MNDPFEDSAEFDLALLPPTVAALLMEVGAPPRLVAHLRLVHDVALRLLDAVRVAWPNLEPDLKPDLKIDCDAVRFGAATHDIGKALHPDELYEPGNAHEVEGRHLLMRRGFDDRFARFAQTHAAWKAGGECTLEDLLVALADTCWKGQRSETLENLICDQMQVRVPDERWEIFARIDTIIDKLARDADRRLAWQSQY